MQYSFAAVGALLLATAAAQPHGHHQHRHAKRNVAVVTDVVDVTETVLLTAIVWVDEQGHTISPVVTDSAKETRTGAPKTTVKPGIFDEPASVQAPVATPTPSPDTTTVQVASASTQAPVAPVVPPSPVSVPEPTTPAAPSVVIPSAVVANTPTPSVSAPAPSGGSGGGSPTGECSEGSPCHGDITFYQAGLGACGITNDGSVDHIVALAHDFMGEQSNGNPFCGKTVTINHNGQTIQATVQDKCMGCVGRDLDLSNAAFDALGIAESVGRTTADWFFN
jgi:hypothetical protein